MDIRHSQGEDGEQAVNTIAFHTYLKYWCYPNPKDERGSKKEICDLLILFKDTAIIISIKNYSFKGDYEKYFRSTLDKAISQVQGAERKLFDSIANVYIKHPDLEEICFNPQLYKNVYRLIVNLHTGPLFYPGGKKTSKGKYIHIFNWFAFLKVVQELDTIPDFIHYLKTREEAFLEKDVLIMTGKEEDWDIYTGKEFHKYMEDFNPTEKVGLLLSGNELDLLADYYFNEKKFNKEIYSTEYNMGSFELDGKWERYLSREEVQRKKKEDRASYFVDEFVKREVLYKTDRYNLEIATELLSFSRFERRILGKHFLEFCERYKNENGFFTARRYGKVNDTVIGFLLHGHTMPQEMVLTLMDIAIKGYCLWDKYQSKKIILISVSNKLGHFKYGYLNDIQPLSKEDEEIIEHDLKVLNWFQNIENIVFNIKEYPDK